MKLRHRPIWRRLPVAWLQLTHQRFRMAAAILGVTFATLLMFAQLGLKESLLDSSASIEAHLTGDLFVLDRRSQAITSSQPFSRRLLVLARNFNEVESVSELLVAVGQLKHPLTGTKRSVLALGIDPNSPALDLPQIRDFASELRLSDTLLYDEANSDYFGPIVERFRRDPRLRIQLEQQRLRIAGLFHLGASFAADGTLILGKQSFQRTFPDRSGTAVDIGVIKLRVNSSAESVRAGMQQILPLTMRIMNRSELVAWQQEYWGENTSIGFIFNQGVVIGFLVGLVIVYQILFTGIATHLKEYATLKAIGYGDGYLVGLVFEEALILSTCGYIPGLIASLILYYYTEEATSIPMTQTPDRCITVFLMTLVMCFLSGLLAARKLRQAAPAEVF
jgi:putative ABC transport system permease protein